MQHYDDLIEKENKNKTDDQTSTNKKEIKSSDISL